MEAYMSIFWLVTIIVAAVAESFTAQMISIWFMVSGVISLVLSLFNLPVSVQIFSFFGFALLLLLLTRPFVKKFLNFPKIKTNWQQYIGASGVVIETIDNLKSVGLVNVLGSVWSAKSQDGQIIEKDELVNVLDVKGVKLIVTKNKER